MINLYVANLGKYNEGILKGAWITLPATNEEIETFLAEEVGINEYYEEYAIHDFECDVEGVEIREYSNISNLNEIAEILDNAGEYEIEVAEALVEVGYYKSIVEALENLDCHGSLKLDDTFNTDRELGYTVVEELYCGISEVGQDLLERYFDMERFARELSWDFDIIVEDMEEEDKKELAEMSEEEFANWYIDGLGSIAELGQGTLESYFDYEMFGRDLQMDGFYVASNNIVIF